MINTLKPDLIFCVNEDVCTHAHPYLGIKNCYKYFSEVHKNPKYKITL